MTTLTTRRAPLAVARRSRPAPSAGARHAVLVTAQIAILVVLLGAWEIGAGTGAVNTFLFSSPSRIVDVIGVRLASGQLFTDIGVTGLEVLIGFIIGAVGGSILGLALWYSKFVADLTAPFVAAIGAIPVLAIAPITIVWFGTGIASKIVIVALSCVVVSLTTAYRGAQRTDPDLINLLRSFGAPRVQIFAKAVVPGAMPWVFSALKLNVGFAIVGAIVGEYISSDAGLGHMILLGSSNFTISIVLAGIALVMVLVFVFGALVTLLEKLTLKWERP